MTHPSLTLVQIRKDLAYYARKRDEARGTERIYYALLWKDAVNRLQETLIYK